MGFRDAVSSVPAKPIVAIGLGLTVIAAAWHGVTLRSACLARAELSAGLHKWAQHALANPGIAAPLARAAPFAWDDVRIAQGGHDLGAVPSCPFGWHWSNDQRRTMANEGNLTLIGFFAGGKLVAIADFDRRWARFDVADKPIARARARFVSSGDGLLALAP